MTMTEAAALPDRPTLDMSPALDALREYPELFDGGTEVALDLETGELGLVHGFGVSPAVVGSKLSWLISAPTDVTVELVPLLAPWFARILAGVVGTWTREHPVVLTPDGQQADGELHHILDYLVDTGLDLSDTTLISALDLDDSLLDAAARNADGCGAARWVREQVDGPVLASDMDLCWLISLSREPERVADPPVDDDAF